MHRCARSAERVPAQRRCHVRGGCPATVTGMALSGVADLVGRVLAGRYRLLAPIGTGASGRVYVADDVRLRRKVAVKVLHSGPRRGRRIPPPVPHRSPARGVAAPPEHHGGLRLGRRRRPLHGARAPRGGLAAGPARPRPAVEPVAGRARRSAGRRRARVRPLAGVSCTVT